MKRAYIGAGIMAIGAILLGPARVGADTVYLYNGEQVEGTIQDENKHRVLLQTERSGMQLLMQKDIQRIEKTNEAPRAVTEDVPPTETGPVSDNKAELIRRLLQANGALDGLQRNFSNMVQGLPAEKQAEARQVLHVGGFIEALIPLYAQYYTEADLKELIKFYTSELGQKHINATPRLVEKSIPLALDYFQKRLEMLEAQVQ